MEFLDSIGSWGWPTAAAIGTIVLLLWAKAKYDDISDIRKGKERKRNEIEKLECAVASAKVAYSTSVDGGDKSNISFCYNRMRELEAKLDGLKSDYHRLYSDG